MKPPPYPCRCLCFGFVQITLTTPLRWMTLQLSHIFLTEALTFISHLPSLIPGASPRPYAVTSIALPLPHARPRIEKSRFGKMWMVTQWATFRKAGWPLNVRNCCHFRLRPGDFGPDTG